MSKNFTFNTSPTIQMKRSRIKGLSYGVNSSYSLGKLYPFYCEEVLPGDTFKVNSKFVSRLTSQFMKPIYGNLFVDTHYFFVPWRLVYDDFACVFGENKEGYWANPRVYEVPHTSGTVNIASKSIADYLEMPVGETRAPINILYHRALALIWNEWFRDENYQEPVLIHKGNMVASEAFNNREWSVSNYTGMCPPVNKYHDYFTSVLPEPQKGDSIMIPVGSGTFPVVTTSDYRSVYGQPPLRFGQVNGGTFPAYSGAGNTLFDYTLNLSAGDRSNVASASHSGTAIEGSTGDTNYFVAPSNLSVTVDGLESVSVNDLRLAFQTQKILERDALGTRYVEHILNTFGVTNPDARLQRPELLNSSRFPLNIQQVASTAGGADELAKLGGYSLTSGKNGFSKAFSEYGCVIGVLSIRQFHSYQQGLPKRYNRYKRLHYYNPALAYIGMMPVQSTEIYAGADPDDIFGFQRAWAEYRHHQNAVTGEMRSGAENTLDMWHLADEYANQPVAGSEFLSETPNYLDRTITVSSDVQDQFIFDIWHDVDAVRVMPANPMPGLIDHY